jgi:hypothetical protein
MMDEGHEAPSCEDANYFSLDIGDFIRPVHSGSGLLSRSIILSLRPFMVTLPDL